MAVKVLLSNVRIAFPALFEPQSVEGSEPKYGVKIIVDPANKAQVKELEAALVKAATEKWGAKAEQVLARLNKTGRKAEVAFVKEPYTTKDGDPYDGFEGMFYVTANSKTRPLIIDRDKSPLVAADGRPYAGCYCNVQIEFWAQDNKWGRGVRAQLKGVQFARDGDAFAGGAPASSDDFDDLSAAADETYLA